MAVDQLLVRLIGEGSSYRKMMDAANAQTKKFEKSINDTSKRIGAVGKKATSMGKRLSVGVTLPLVGIGAAAVNEFAKFDQAMTKSTSIMGDLGKEADNMRQVALSLSGEVTQGPKELADSYFFLASAGLNAEQSMKALPQVAKFATAGAFDMALATDLLTDAQSALGLTSKDAEKNLSGMARVADVLVKANTLANASVQQFSESLTNTAGATLKNFNKPIEEGVAVLAAYADQGIKAQVAGTNLTRVTLLLQQAAQKNAKAHKDLGFQVFDANGKMNKYSNLIGQLERITKGMTDETKAATLAQLGFQARVQNAILPLIGSSQKIEEYERKLRSAGGITDEVANKQMKAFTNQMKLLKNQATVAAIELGQALAPVVLELNKLIRQAMKVWNSLNKETKTNVAVAIMLAAVLGPVLIIVGLLISSLSAIIPVITAVGATIAGLAAGPLVLILVAIAGVVAALAVFTIGWENALTIVGNVIDLIVDYVITGIRIQSRALMAFAGWIGQQFAKIFTVDFPMKVIQGIGIAARKIAEFGKWAIKKLRALFTGEETGTVDDLIKNLGVDIQAGFKTDDILGTLKGIADEELTLLGKRREGKEIIPTDVKPVIEAKIVETKDSAFGAMEEMKEGVMELVEQGKKEANKQGLDIAALELTR